MTAESNLSNFIDQHCNESHLRVQEDLGDGFVRLRSEEAERRQAAHDIRSSEDIVIEMLRNSRDAGARNIFLATGKEGDQRSFVMIDDGSGIPAHLHDLIFEPRVTSKLDTVHMDKWGVHGRGMALFSIQQNATSSFVVSSESGLGSSIKVTTDTTTLREKADQSTFPILVRNENGTVSMKGPKNILRTACEFALEHRHSINVYVGSAADVAATLYAFGMASTPARILAFGGADERVPLVKQLAYSSDSADFVAVASGLGLDMSIRTAYRILDGKIAALDSLLERMSSAGLLEVATSRAAKKKGRGLISGRKSAVSIPRSQLDTFTGKMMESFSEMADSLYLQAKVNPKVAIKGGELHISIPLVNQDDV